MIPRVSCFAHFNFVVQDGRSQYAVSPNSSISRGSGCARFTKTSSIEPYVINGVKNPRRRRWLSMTRLANCCRRGDENWERIPSSRSISSASFVHCLKAYWRSCHETRSTCKVKSTGNPNVLSHIFAIQHFRAAFPSCRFSKPSPHTAQTASLLDPAYVRKTLPPHQGSLAFVYDGADTLDVRWWSRSEERPRQHVLQTARRERERHWTKRIAGRRFVRRFVVDWDGARTRSVSHRCPRYLQELRRVQTHNRRC